jgi:hypothetical protein
MSDTPPGMSDRTYQRRRHTLHRTTLLCLALAPFASTRIRRVLALTVRERSHRLLKVVFPEITPLVDYQVDAL